MLLRTEKLSKSFNGVYALSNINFEVEAGEVHGLVGENGAGKSTLIKMLTGVYSIDEGTVFWEDQPVKIPNPSQSRTLGINVVHQDRTLIPTFDGVENAYLGREYPHKGMQVDWKTMWETVEKTRDELGIELDLSKMAIELSPPQKTCLEIIRAMMNDCKLLILDEPTASLTDKESEILFDIIGKLKKKGTSVLYVSHRMDEIFRLTDRITVFKNGSMVSCVKTSEVDKDKLVSMMTDEWKGSDIVHNTNFGKVLLEVQGIRTKDGVMKKGSLKVREKEILGVFGLGGSGRTELLEGIYGYRPITEGTVTIDGEQLEDMTEKKLSLYRRKHLGYIFQMYNLIPNLTLRENIEIGAYLSNRPLDVDELMQTLGIYEHQNKLPNQLSGGQQQRTAIGRAIVKNPDILLCDEPTGALDYKTSKEILKLIETVNQKYGNTIIMVTHNDAIKDMADRVVKLRDGMIRKNYCNEHKLSASELEW